MNNIYHERANNLFYNFLLKSVIKTNQINKIYSIKSNLT